jgi:hypothetical protein
MIQRRLRRVTLVFGVVGLFLFMPTRAWAFCEALSSDSWQDGVNVWAEHYVVFDPSISFPEGYQCGWAEWEGWMVFYDIQTEIHTPTQMVEIQYGSGQNSAYSSAYFSIAAGGSGTYTIKGSGYETWVGNGGYWQGTFVYGDRIEQVSAPPSAPWVTLYATNYSPPQDSGPVLVWAYLDGEGYPTEVVWDGCLPASFLECYVDTSTAGTKTVTWWGLFGDIWRFAGTTIEVEPSGSGSFSVSGAVFIDYNGNGVFDEGDYPVAETTVYLTDQADTTVYATSVTTSAGAYQFDTVPAGGYRVKHPVPDGYERTTDDSLPFNVPPNLNYNFGLQPKPQACSGPTAPTINKKGWLPNSNFTFRFLSGFSGTQGDAQADGVRFAAAFDWTTRNVETGLNVRFFETWDAGENISVMRAPLPGDVAAEVRDFVVDGNGHMIGARMTFTTDVNILSAYIGYRKAALHEFGHLHGFADSFVPPSRRAATVMNQLNGRDDMGKPGDGFPHLPDRVTPCDAQQALNASNMP